MTKKFTPAVNVGALELEHWQQGSFFAGSDTSFGAMLGLKGLGISYNEVPPGKSGCPFHNHHVEEELFVILDGEGEYRFGDQRLAISKGDVLGAPAGGGTQHVALANRKTLVAEAIFAFTVENDEEFFLDMMVVKGTAGLSGRYLVIADPKALQAEHRPEGGVAAGKEAALLPMLQLERADIDGGCEFLRHEPPLRRL